MEPGTRNPEQRRRNMEPGTRNPEKQKAEHGTGKALFAFPGSRFRRYVFPGSAFCCSGLLDPAGLEDQVLDLAAWQAQAAEHLRGGHADIARGGLGDYVDDGLR